MSKKVYFIGIGGIGVSALAQYYLQNKWQVFGSDLVGSEITDSLKKLGAKIFIGENSKNIKKDIEKIIISPAIKEQNQELKKARELKIPVQTYPEALGDLSRENFTIAISGAHGKSTTTAMTALVLIEAGFDPTVVVGTKLKEFGNSNFRIGKSKYLVIEACEYEDSFLNYLPKIGVITNIDKEHLDYFKNLKGVISSFQKFVEKIGKNGTLVLNKDDENLKKLKILDIEKFGFSLKQKEAKKLRQILKVLGDYNIQNALAALTIARVLKIPDEISFRALSKFQGTWRRFEIEEKSYQGKKFTYISDYAHHPNKIKAMLKGAREKYPDKKIWCVFQPHQYQRTYFLFKDFVDVLQKAPVDKLILVPIYSVFGRETAAIKKQVDSAKLARKIREKTAKNKVFYKNSIEKAADYIKANLKGGEIIIAMGAGDIYGLKKLV
ncbi:MAG: Mur ligase domain-containing protein [bacterium]|nr:Mur ligase domain-containing protein [bacterium]